MKLKNGEGLDHNKIAIDVDRPLTQDEVPDEQSEVGHRLGQKIAKGSKVFTNNVGLGSPKESIAALKEEEDV